LKDLEISKRAVVGCNIIMHTSANHVLSVGDADDGGAMQAALVGISKQHTLPNIFIKGKHLGGCDG
jgi:glutaredoxin-related protein